MESKIKNRSRICPIPPRSKTGLNWHLRPRTIMAVGLTFMLTTTGLAYYLIRPPPIIILDGQPQKLTRHTPIIIDGDTSFSDIALLEGWLGDGSPENPYIIDGLKIDLGGVVGHGINISNTRVSFTISNCIITGAYWGHGPCFCIDGAAIFLINVTNGELVNNTCNSNGSGITLYDSYSNTIANNICNNNTNYGIYLGNSDGNNVTGNTCNRNEQGIYLYAASDSNTEINNICNYNTVGIIIYNSDFNTVENNTCISNADFGIGLHDSNYITVENNYCSNDSIGISLFWSNYNAIISNTCNDNTIRGIFLDGSHDNRVWSNTCSKNTESGIYLFSSGGNRVFNNKCNRNGNYGIFLNLSDMNFLTGNTCNSNKIGIYLYESFTNTVTANIYLNNTEHDLFVEFES